jgi:hypothetical protein
MGVGKMLDVAALEDDAAASPRMIMESPIVKGSKSFMARAPSVPV